MKKKQLLKYFYLACFFSIISDQISKFFIRRILQNGEIEIFKFFSLTYVGNKGVLFGLFSSSFMKIPVIVISVVVVLVIFFYALNFSPEIKFLQISLGLIEGGIVGNLIDRIRFGYVVDFLNFKIWPVFNLSDIFIVSGTFLTIFFHMRSNRNAS